MMQKMDGRDIISCLFFFRLGTAGVGKTQNYEANIANKMFV